MSLQSHIANVPSAARVRPVLWVLPWVICGILALVFQLVVPQLVDDYWQSVLIRVGVFVIAAVSLNIVNGYTGQFSMGHAGFMAVGGYVAGATTYYGSLYMHGVVGDLAFYSGGVGFMLLGIVLGACVAGGFGYLVGLPSLRLRGDYLAIVTLGFGEIIRVLLELTRPQVNAGVLTGVRDLVGERGAPTLRALVELAPPVMPPGQPVPTNLLPTAEAVNRVLGESGIVESKMSQLLTLLSSADAAAVKAFWHAPLGVLKGIPLNSSTGFFGIPGYATLFWVFLFVGITCVIAYRIKQSSSGRAFLSVREDEIAARAMGVNLTRYKVRAFVLAAVLGGVAGGLLVHTGVNPSPTDASFQRSFDIVIFVVLGGLGSMSGAALAAVFLTLMSQVLLDPGRFASGWWVALLIAGGLLGIGLWMRAARIRGHVVLLVAAAAPAGLIALALIAQGLKSTLGIDLANYRMIVYALLLIFAMLVRPNGLLGIREIWDLFTPGHSPKGGGGATPSSEALKLQTVTRLGGER